jgi:protein-arginine kinase activator protein McsA
VSPSAYTPQAQAQAHTKGKTGTGQVPVTLEDLRQVEQALFQSPKSRFSTSQRIFFEALLSEPDLDPSKAAALSGVKLQTAKQWLARGDCQQALNHLLTQRLTRLGIDKDSLLLRIVDCLELSMGDKPIKKVAFDSKAGCFHCEEVFETDLGSAARFTDQLAKHFRLYGDNNQQAVSVSINLQMGNDTLPSPAIAERIEEALSVANQLKITQQQESESDDDEYDFLR